MTHPPIAVGFSAGPQPPLATVLYHLRFARLLRLDSFFIWDHLQNIIPTTLWERRFSWVVGRGATPHACFEFQTMLGYLAKHAGGIRLGVGVTEPIRRHPVIIAQAMVTLAHLTRRAPILGIGAGERENVEPYGLDFTHTVSRLEEALQIIRLCFAARGPLDFAGTYYQLDHAMFDLRAPNGRTPEIWIGGIGPRMLRLTGQYGDGWYPVGFFPPAEYATKLAAIHTAARAAGRDPASITPSLQPYILVAPTEREARAMLDTRAIRYMGLLVPAEYWRQAGLTHPFGDDFRGYIDFLPERYSRAELEDAIAAVPPALGDVGVIRGTPEQVVQRLREYGDAGMRHVVPQLLSAIVSRRAALYSLYALRLIARQLAAGR